MKYGSEVSTLMSIHVGMREVSRNVIHVKTKCLTYLHK